MTTADNRPEDQGKTPESEAPIAEPVYAPASERVPKTVPGYGDVVSHTDPATPERQAAVESEPSFARVTRPTYTPPTETGEPAWDTPSSDWMSSGGGMPKKRFGWIGLAVAAGVGVWLWMRWRRERNKPINRLRRQARQAAERARQRASALRSQMPDMPEFPDEARRPAVGLGTALLSLAIVVWQQSRARSRAEMRAQEANKRADKMSRQARKMGKHAADTLSDVDWMQRLQQLKEKWNPGRVEIEKTSISRRH
ncbi:MAG: hypothetical protein JO352_20615 [Chloroflexi bacterium]|nr:hypothetical protein [Chloroflexota bacterium]